MDHAITVGMVVWTSVIALGIIGVLAVVLWVLSIFAEGFRH